MKIPCPFQSYNTPGLVCFSSSSVSPLGFLLLEHLEVEGLLNGLQGEFALRALEAGFEGGLESCATLCKTRWKAEC